MFSLHTRIALLTLLPLLLWMTVRFVKQQRAIVTVPMPPIQISIEHTGNAAVTITRTMDTQPQLIDIANEGTGFIHIKLPDAWERGEIRGAPLAFITVEEPTFGYRRWHIPTGTTLSFTNPLPWTGMRILNPTALPLRLRTVTVNLEKKSVERESYLLSDESLTLP